MPDDVDWLMGDFNLLRDPNNRNRRGGDVNDIFLFNVAISALRLVDMPLQGRRFTWTNRQFEPCWKVWIGFILLPLGLFPIQTLQFHH